MRWRLGDGSESGGFPLFEAMANESCEASFQVERRARRLVKRKFQTYRNWLWWVKISGGNKKQYEFGGYSYWLSIRLRIAGTASDDQNGRVCKLVEFKAVHGEDMLSYHIISHITQPLLSAASLMANGHFSEAE